MKHLILITLLLPGISLAWSSPVLESKCDNYIDITLPVESNYVIEFSGDNFTTVTEVDFIHAGTHSMHIPINGTLSARFKSDHNAKTSVTVKDCKPKSTVKKSKRRHHGYVRRPVAPVVLPLFDLPLFDYPYEVKLPDIKG